MTVKLAGVNEFYDFLVDLVGPLNLRMYGEGWFGVRVSFEGTPCDLRFHRVYKMKGIAYAGLEYNVRDLSRPEEVTAFLETFLDPFRGLDLTFPTGSGWTRFQGYGGVAPEPKIVRLLEGVGASKVQTTMRHDEYALKRGILRVLRVGPEAGRQVELYQESFAADEAEEATIQLDLMRQDVALFNTIKRSLV